MPEGAVTGSFIISMEIGQRKYSGISISSSIGDLGLVLD